MDLLFKISAIILTLFGVVIVYGAKIIVKKFDLASKQVIKLEGIEEEKEKELKELKALARVKVYGAIVFLPGMILILIAFN